MKHFPALLAAGMALFSRGSTAAEVPPGLLENLQKLAPGIHVDRVETAPVPGLYEVTVGPVILYVSKDGRYMLRGDLVDLTTRSNITDDKRRKARLEAINKLGEGSMIVFAPKTAKHTITVFTDVDCPYCAKLHQEMDQYHKLGIRVRYLAYPRAGIPSGSYDKMVSVWCAEDQRKAMTDAKAGRSVTPKKCDNPIREHMLMGRMVGVSGTPAIILDDGEMVPGYVPAPRLVQMLEQDKPG